MLRGVLSRLAGQYPSVVVDNEAGLENLSRRTVQKVDWLVFVTDPSARGFTTARRLYDLALEMEVSAGAMGVVVNRARDAACLERARSAFAGTPVVVLGALPEDEALAHRDEQGEPVFGLPLDNAALGAADAIFCRLAEAVASSA